MAKLFLGGISPQTTTEAIIDYFSAFGAVQDAVAMMKDGRPRCFGFVTFEDPQSAQAVLAEEHHLDGNRMDIKSADGKKQEFGRPAQTAPQPFRAAPFAQAAPQAYRAAPYGRPQPLDYLYAPQEEQFGRGQQMRVDPVQQQEFIGGTDRRNGGAKLFLGGTSPNTTTEGIRELFQQYGAILDAVAMINKDGSPRCFGFVTFEDQEVADAVIAEHAVNPIELDGHSLDLKSAAPPGQAPGPKGKGKMQFQQQFQQQFQPAMPMQQFQAAVPMQQFQAAGSMQTGPKTEKIFVGGLAPEVSQDELVDYFGQYGAIVDSVVMIDKATGKPKGFGFVTFDSSDSVELVMRDVESHQLGGKWVECKKADGQKGGGGGKGGGKGFEGGAKGFGGFGGGGGYGPQFAGGKGYQQFFGGNAPAFGHPGKGCFGPKGGFARGNPYV